MPSLRFKATLYQLADPDHGLYFDVPFDLVDAFGVRGQIRLRGTINRHPLQTTARPHGDGTHFIVLGQQLHAALGVSAGDEVRLVLEKDSSRSSLPIADDFARLLAANPELDLAFQRLPSSHQKEYLEWIESAKSTPARERRMQKALEMLAEKRRS